MHRVQTFNPGTLCPESLIQGPCWIGLERGDFKRGQSVGQEVLDEVPSLVNAMRNVVSMLISSDPEFVFRLADVLSPTSHTEDQVNTVRRFVSQRSGDLENLFVVSTHYPSGLHKVFTATNAALGFESVQFAAD